ncbi:MAG: PD-(D/E)XK nuclease family protein [Myxococcales bacterium]|nr:PD-(D/E)XK nuclease family protein [Myxococcales bacterium]
MPGFSPTLTLTPLVGVDFGGTGVTEHDDLAVGAAALGRPVWGPLALLANLELRLGLPTPQGVDAVRVQRWARRLDDLPARASRFYARSSAVDRLGTATTLLGMRDELVNAGWDGEPIAGGGERLATLAELEREADVGAPGEADRLRAVERELAASTVRPFDALHLVEHEDVWPGRWRRVFARFAALGTSVRHATVDFERASGDSDLTRAQAALRGERPGPLRGDGSLVLLRGETSWGLAAAVAALLRVRDEASCVVLRGGDASALDGALTAAGLGSQGLASTSAWRPALQVLPLAIEIAFEPKDPYRILELLTLPSGPFHGFVGQVLARALSEAPGVGGPHWQRAKRHIAEHITDAGRRDTVLATIEHWLELPGHPMRTGAPRAALLEVAGRVVAWFQAELPAALAQVRASPLTSRRLAVLGEGYQQAQAFHAALGHDARDTLDLVDARLLVEQIASRHPLELVAESAGRIDAADAPSLVRVPRDLVVWWHFVMGTEWRPRPRPFRLREVAALRAAGVHLPEPAARLTAEATAWRQVVLAARKRLVLVVPRCAAGAELEPHPMWSEIAARLGAEPSHVAAITVEAADLVAAAGRSILTTRAMPVLELSPLQLPPPRADWNVEAGALAPGGKYSASYLAELVGCPLRWVLGRRGRCRAGDLESIPRGPLLHGLLAHRVVEELHRAGALARPEDVRASFAAVFEQVVEHEAAVLLRPGMTFELAQLRSALERAVEALSTTLLASRLRVVEVESSFDVPWRGGQLGGQIDLLLVDPEGTEVVLDLKWGRSAYVAALVKGRSIQLAVYAAARAFTNPRAQLPRGGYFVLKKGQFLTTEDDLFSGVRPIEGPSLRETWSSLEQTVARIEAILATGRIPVSGVSRSLPLHEAIGFEAEGHIVVEPGAACEYCPFPAICGRRWERGLA